MRSDPGCSLEGLMLKLKLQYFGHLMRRADSFEKTLMKRPKRSRAGGEGDDRGWDGWMPSLTQWTWVWVNSGNWWWTGRPVMLQFMGSQRVRHNWVTELNQTELLLGRKVMTNLDSILKSRDITLLTKVRLVNAMVFLVAMYGCESWTIEKAEHRRIDAFELWC